MLAKWIAHATVDLDLSSFMLVLQKEARRESSMCDPFCENPAFLARAILTLIKTNFNATFLVQCWGLYFPPERESLPRTPTVILVDAKVSFSTFALTLMAVFVRDQRVPKCKMNGNLIMKQIELEFNFISKLD